MGFQAGPAAALAALLLPLLLLPGHCEARGLYAEAGAGGPAVLAAGSVRDALRGSASAWLLQFYSASCGHCVAFAPRWRVLAEDVRDWDPAIRIGVLDCGDEENYETCKEFGIQFYPTFRYFRAFTKEFTTGETQHAGPDRALQTVRQTMIDFLQNHSQEARPPACPPLGPVEPEVVLSLLNKNSLHYTAIIFESADSYMGREVILDLIPYENVVVKRALNSNSALLEKLGIASVPSAYLLYPNGSHGLVNILKPLRSFFSSYLKSLPGVRRKLSPPLPLPAQQNRGEHLSTKAWRDYDRSKLYMADLESGLHYLLRVELATHRTLEGAELRTFKDLITILAKLFPGRQAVVKLLETLQVWLVSLPLERIPYDAVLDLLNNKMRIAGLFLPSRVQWWGCKGSRPELRGYTCAFWELFHTLTVQAAVRPGALQSTGFEDDPRAVLQVLRSYVRDFFGCRACAQHFEQMASQSLELVKTWDEAVLWLWEKHNVVNARLAGALSEDPRFPKAQWPPPEACPACHEEARGLHVWSEAQVLPFLKQHYGRANLLPSPAEDQGGSEEPGLPGEGGGPSAKKQSGRPEARLLDPPPRAPTRGEQGPRASVEEEMKQAVSFLGGGFSSLDMSLCIALYVASSLFLMIVYFFFRARSKRWKMRPPRPYV